MSRVQELYQNMKKYFVKDIARLQWRKNMAASASVNGAMNLNHNANTNVGLNPGLKRERPESDSPIAKRRDTGENKASPASPALTSSSVGHTGGSLPPLSNPMQMPPPPMYPANVDGTASAMQSSINMASQMPGANPQQQALTAARARQFNAGPYSQQSQQQLLQMSHTQQNGQQMQPVTTPQRPSSQIGRHMSPSATSGPTQVSPFVSGNPAGANAVGTNMPSSSSIPMPQISPIDNQNHNGQSGNVINGVNGTNNTLSAQMAAVSQLGPAAVASFQILQTPNHPFVQYMTAHVPNFASMTLREQLQQMQMLQVRLIFPMASIVAVNLLFG